MSRYWFFFNDTATTEIYTLSLHDALPIYGDNDPSTVPTAANALTALNQAATDLWGLTTNPFAVTATTLTFAVQDADRKSTRLNSSHANISYAVFCLKKTHTESTTHRPILI